MPQTSVPPAAPPRSGPAALHVHIPEAGAAWRLVMQSGARIACKVNIPLAELLRAELGLSEEQLSPADTFLVNGMPVDDPATALVADKSRVALAAGLPGIAGLAMKQGSAVRALRADITARAARGTEPPRPGSIVFFLYSLMLPLLADHFLRRGVEVDAAQLLRYARLAPSGRCECNGRPASLDALAQRLAAAPQATRVFLTASVMS